MTHKPEDTAPRILEPCRHMEAWVNGLADGSLKGPARWYTRFHVMGCAHCRTALAALQEITVRLHELDRTPANSPAALTSDRRVALQLALDAIDQNQHKGNNSL